MSSQPTPRNGDDAEAAEARLEKLHNRFAKVSRFSKTSGRAGTGATGGSFDRLPLSVFEMLILGGAALFVVLAAVLFWGG